MDVAALLAVIDVRVSVRQLGIESVVIKAIDDWTHRASKTTTQTHPPVRRNFLLTLNKNAIYKMHIIVSF